MSLERRRLLFERLERALQLPMLALAVVFLAGLAVPEVVDLADEAQAGIDVLMWLIWAAFAAELVAMTYLSANRRRYLMTHWPDVIIVAVPFLRPLRLLRLVVVGARFWEAAQVSLRRHTFSLVISISVVAAGVASVLMYAAERHGDGPIHTFPDALWWAAATITTVGYGDMYPTTTAGRSIAVLLMLLGISIFGVLTARLAAFFVVNDDEQPEDLQAIVQQLSRIEQRLDQIQHCQDCPAVRIAA